PSRQNAAMLGTQNFSRAARAINRGAPAVLLSLVESAFLSRLGHLHAYRFVVCLCIVGMVMGLLNCFFAQLQPRYILPMMELLLLSLVILLGVLFSGYESPNNNHG